MGHYGSLQIWRPTGKVVGKPNGGFNNEVGTPGLLRDLSDLCYQSSWTDTMQGGLEKAQFDCRMTYEDSIDIDAGNWVMFALLGASLASNANPGDTTLTIQNNVNQQLPQFNDLQKGDYVVITDGTNAEFFYIASIAGNRTITLRPAWGVVQVSQLAILTKNAIYNTSQIFVSDVLSLSPGQQIVLAGDNYKITSGWNGKNPVTLNSALTSNYAAGTPLSDCAPGATEFTVDQIDGIPATGGPTIFMSEGVPGVYEAATVQSLPDPHHIKVTSALSNAHPAGSQIAFQMNASLRNAYVAGHTIIARVQWTGYLDQRIHSTAILAQFSVSSSGFFNRYNFLIDSSTVQAEDCGAQMLRDIGSYGPTLPSMIIRHQNFQTPNGPSGGSLGANGIKCNIQATDEQFLQIIDTILRQENGNSLAVQWAVWVGPDRQVYHQPIATSPKNAEGKGPAEGAATPTIGLSLSDASYGANPNLPSYGDTISSIQATDMDMTNLINAAIVTGTTAPDSSGIYNINTTTLAAPYAAGQNKATLTYVPPSWPPGGTFQGLYLLANRKGGSNGSSGAEYILFGGDTATLGPNWGGHGTGWRFGFEIGTQVEIVTQFQNASNKGAQQITVKNASIFQAGQQITLTLTGSNTETRTIQAVNYNTNVITFVQATNYNHAANDGVALAANGSGTGPRILVEQEDSIYGGVTAGGKHYGGYGFFEGTLTSEDIYDENQLAQWAAKQLSVTAWPVFNSEIQLPTTSCRISGRDLIEVNGFSDGSVLTQNVSQVQYTSTVADQNVAATLQCGVMKSTAQSVIGSISKEKSRRIKYKLPQKHGPNNGHLHGGMAYQTGNGIDSTDPGNLVNFDAVTVKLNGQVFQAPAVTAQPVPDGTSYWGVSCGPGVATPAIVELPKRWWSGRSVYTYDSAWVVPTMGDDPQMTDQFTGQPLWKITCKFGYIVGFEPLFETHGKTLAELPSVTAPSAPMITGGTVAAAPQVNGLAGDVAISGVINNFPTDGSTSEMKFYVRTTGTLTWSHKHTMRAQGLPQPSASQSFAIVISGIPLGNTIDIAVTVDGFNDESSPTILQSGYVMPASPGALAAPIMTGTAIPTGVGGGATPPPVNANLTLYFRVASGTTQNSGLYIYTASQGWQPLSVNF